MGRPIKKKWFAPAGHPSILYFSFVRFADGSTQSEVSIIEQVATNSYRVQKSEGVYEVIRLAKTTLEANVPNGYGMIVWVAPSPSDEDFAVTKIQANKVSLYDGVNSQYYSVPWSPENIEGDAIAFLRATAHATVVGGVITEVILDFPGIGYILPPVIDVIADTGTDASITATLTDGKVSGFTIVDGGTGYPDNVIIQIAVP